MITFSEIQDAFSFVSSAPQGENLAVLCKDTGRIYYSSESGAIDEIGDEIDCDEFIHIPHKNDLDLGEQLVFKFVEMNLPDEYNTVRQIFGYHGAYGTFKYLLQSKGLLQSWYDFENKCEKEELLKWCEDNEIELTNEPGNDQAETRAKREIPRLSDSEDSIIAESLVSWLQQ